MATFCKLAARADRRRERIDDDVHAAGALIAGSSRIDRVFLCGGSTGTVASTAMADFELQQRSRALGGGTVEAAAPAPGKQTLTEQAGVSVGAVTPSAVSRVRAFHGEEIEIDGTCYRVQPDGSFATAGKVVAPVGGSVEEWKAIASRLLTRQPKPKPKPPTPTSSKAIKLAPMLDADTGRKQFWKAVKYYATLDADPKSRAGWERIRNQYHPSVHPELEAKMKTVVRGLSRAQLADLRSGKPGGAVSFRDAQHIAGDHLVKVGMLKRPRLGPNSLLNFVIGDHATNRGVQAGLERAAGKAMKKAKKAGAANPKQAGLDAAREVSRKRRAKPGMERLAQAEDRIAKKNPPPAPPPPARPPAAAKPRFQIRPPAGPRLGGRGVGGGARNAIGALVQLALGMVLGKLQADRYQEDVDRQIAALGPAIEAAIAARADQLAVLEREDPAGRVFLNLRFEIYQITQSDLEGDFEGPPSVSLAEVAFTRTPWDTTPTESYIGHFGWSETITRVATTQELGLDVAEPR